MYITCNICTDKIRAAYTILSHNRSLFVRGLERQNYTFNLNVHLYHVYVICVTIGTPRSKAQGGYYDQDWYRDG